ncbi:MAG: tRNA (adenosine(37)-N6)-threonylcarbamoyltransferase complex dimerization subunit type 1 TsaB [Phycisphaerales bacterium]
MTGALTLAIETSNPSTGGAGEVALGRVGAHGVEVIGVMGLEPESTHDDALMPAIDRLTRAHGVGAKEIARIAVSAGPGGFTGVRIAVATAKGIGLVTGARCVGVESGLVAAESWEGAGVIAVALASKRSTAWVGVYEKVRGGNARVVEEGVEMDVEGLRAARERTRFSAVMADAHLVAGMREWCTSSGVGVEPLRLTAEGVLRASAGVEDVGADRLAPVYPREPEAVTKWRRLKGE